MDLSIIGAVGSFAISERVLKPKASALFVLGCVLAYDLTTKTHDVCSLRVYRGPALLAFTLMMAAYSLRTWRRNGIACDELIFLPGTHHGLEHGIDGPLIEQPVPDMPVSTTIPEETSHNGTVDDSVQHATSSEDNTQISEPDMAAGGGIRRTGLGTGSQHGALRQRTRSEDVEMAPMLNGNTSKAHNDDIMLRPSTSTDEQDLDVQRESLLDDNKSQESWDMDADDDNDDDDDDEEQGRDGVTSGTPTLLYRNTTAPSVLGTADDTGSSLPVDQQRPPGSGNGRVERFRENHPRLARLGTFFFFRASAPATQQNAAYAPSGPAVFGAALDMSMPILFNFHLFIEAWNHMSGPDGSEATAKILPLIFLSVLIVRTVVPPSRRFRFWGTMKFTLTAPFHQVCVRDEFIGDCLTSWVRPAQDLLFALSYWGTVIWGTATGRYGLSESGEILTESVLLHNVLMPAVAILPLWLKYLQTLRQAYDSNERLPLLNSFKYLSASLVVIYGMTHPEGRRSAGWLTCFVLTLLYQIFWDTIMDWKLFEIQRDIHLVDSTSDQDTWCAQISSFRPESRILLNIQIYVVQPILDTYQRIRAQIPSWRQIQLREQRLYKTESFYWKIFAFNTLTRFTWMLCFIPAYHYTTSSKTVLYSSSDVNSYWGVMLPASEIFRRILWGFLYMEKETLKMMESDAKYQRVAGGNGEMDDDDMDDMNSKFGQDRARPGILPSWLGNQQQQAHAAATTRAKQHEQLMKQLWIVELHAWAVAFVVLGAWAAR